MEKLEYRVVSDETDDSTLVHYEASNLADALPWAIAVRLDGKYTNIRIEVWKLTETIPFPEKTT